MARKWHPAVDQNPQISDRVNTIKENTLRNLENVIDLHLPKFSSNEFAPHQSTSLETTNMEKHLHVISI
jgi:hypothetical protein